LFEANGLRALTVDAIAERAGVGKATIYRWWPNKNAVLMDALLDALAPHIAFPDTGSTREDLRSQLAAVIEVLTTSTAGSAYLALVAESRHDAALARELRRRYIASRRSAAAEVLRRGVERGDLRGDLDPDIAIDALYGALYYRLLVSHTELDPGYADRLLDLIYPTLTP